MADVITRFKLETTQYDSALRDASKSLAAYSKQAELAGKDFDKFTKGGVEAARALGSISTSATNTKDKVKELVSAYNDAARAYNNLTEEQKKSDFGKAMAQSLQQLQGRIKDAKAEMNDTGGVLSQLRERFTVNIDALKVFSVGLQAAQGALSVAKDAFFASEATVDEWGRVMDSSKSLYEGFLTALNTGDISGYLSRIDSIVQAARAAYNELDRLGTMKTIQAPQMSAQQTENERMRMMIQTGRYIAPVDGRRATMQNGQLLTPDQITRIEKQLQNGMQKVVTLVGNEVAQTSRAIDAVYNRQAQELGMSLKEFRKGTSSMAEFDKRIKGAEDYRRYEREHTTYDERTGIGHRDASVNPFEQFAKWSTFRVDGQRYNDLVKLIQQRDQQAGQAYSMQSQAYRTMNRAEGITVRQIMGGSGGGDRSGGGKTETIKTEEQLNNEKIQKLTQEYIKASSDRRKAIEGEIKTLQDRNAEIKRLMEAAQGKAAPDGSLKALSEELSKLQQERQLLNDPIDIELHDQAIKDVQDEIDRLNGKKVELELVVDNHTPFEKLTESLKIEIAEENMQVDTTTLQTLMKTAIQNGIDGLDPNFSTLQEKMREGMNIPDETWQALQDQINEKLKELGIEPIKIDFKTGNIAKEGEKTEKSWQAAAQAVQTVGSAMQSIEDPAAKVAGTVMQAIASIALGYAQATTQAASLGPWAWVAFAATGLAQMFTMINAVHSATGYAQGGIVKGNSYSGDNVPALVDGSQMVGLNAGEVVLTAAQTNNLAAGIQNGGSRIQVVGKLSGEQLFICAERWAKRTGKGEFVTWR